MESNNRPSPLRDKAGSVGTSRREVLFFNPALATPTLSVTPGSASKDTPLPFGKKNGPWIVSPPPPKCLEAQQEVDFGASSTGWIQQKLGRGPFTSFLAFLLGAVLLFLVLGAYVVLVYLAVTTKKPKYVVFSSVLAGIFLLVACNLRSYTPSNGEGGEHMESDNDNDVIESDYGLQIINTPSPVCTKEP